MDSSFVAILRVTSTLATLADGQNALRYYTTKRFASEMGCPTSLDRLIEILNY